MREGRLQKLKAPVRKAAPRHPRPPNFGRERISRKQGKQKRDVRGLYYSPHLALFFVRFSGSEHTRVTWLSPLLMPSSSSARQPRSYYEKQIVLYMGLMSFVAGAVAFSETNVSVRVLKGSNSQCWRGARVGGAQTREKASVHSLTASDTPKSVCVCVCL